MVRYASSFAADGVVIGATIAVVDAWVDSHIGEVFVTVGGEGIAFAGAHVEEPPSLASAIMVPRVLLAVTDYSYPG